MAADRLGNPRFARRLRDRARQDVVVEVVAVDRVLVLDAVRQLETIGAGSHPFARSQAVRQFNALLREAKGCYAERNDIQSLQYFLREDSTDASEYNDAVRRLRVALELRPPASVAAVLEEIHVPEPIAAVVARDLGELREAATLGLAKTTLLLAGVLAEALLLSRHPDRSDRGPGLRALVDQARSQKLFGRDVLRQLENLVDYRDLIHPRAEIRNRIEPNQARIEAALSALKLLSAELEDPEIRYE